MKDNNPRLFYIHIYDAYLFSVLVVFTGFCRRRCKCFRTWSSLLVRERWRQRYQQQFFGAPKNASKISGFSFSSPQDPNEEKTKTPTLTPTFVYAMSKSKNWRMKWKKGKQKNITEPSVCTQMFKYGWKRHQRQKIALPFVVNYASLIINLAEESNFDVSIGANGKYDFTDRLEYTRLEPRLQLSFGKEPR